MQKGEIYSRLFIGRRYLTTAANKTAQRRLIAQLFGASLAVISVCAFSFSIGFAHIFTNFSGTEGLGTEAVIHV